MIELDCETPELAYKSLKKILGVPEKEFNVLFKSLKSPKYYDINGWPQGNNRIELRIQNWLNSKISHDIPNYAILWFHGTRVSQDEIFSAGIKPLHDVIDKIWNGLHSMISNQVSVETWQQFRTQVENNHINNFSYLYQRKMSRLEAGGPFANLVREICVSKSKIFHDYLKTPEIVEDIHHCCKDLLGINLLGHYKRNTRPCIVKFRNNMPQEKAILAAISYLYKKFYNCSPGLDDNTCFSGHGNPISPENIIKVEYL
jgi:hypothetical protein